MIRSLLVLFMLAQAAVLSAAENPAPVSGSAPAPETVSPEKASPAPAANLPAPPSLSAGPKRFYVMRVEGELSEPMVFMVRKGVKEAIAASADVVVLDMHTPGGRSDWMSSIIESLERFPGETITFVNKEAISAGALIAATTNRIYMTPGSVIGDAAPIGLGGEDIDDTARAKAISYMSARTRAASEGHRFRADVVMAMIERDYELKIGEEVIREKGGKLLTLTHTEAVKTYGEPPQPLLAQGIVQDIEELYSVVGEGRPVEVREFQVTWSLSLARWLTAISPILLGIGGLALAIEFKTPGFGWLGISGVALILIVMFGHHVAGLAGHEPMLFFLLGVALVFVEILLLPGTIVFAAAGLLLMLGSLLWGMADTWPGDGLNVSPSIFLTPAYKLSLGLFFGGGLFIVVLKYLPASPLWGRMVLSAEVSDSATAAPAREREQVAIGESGVVVSPLRPTGTVEIAGRRFEARSEIDELETGARIRVVRRADFVLIVERLES